MEGGVTVPTAGDRPLTLLGLDPFAEGPFRAYLDAGGGAGNGDLGGLIVRPGQVVLPREEARARRPLPRGFPCAPTACRPWRAGAVR